MSKTLKPVGYTVKSGDLYLQKHDDVVFGLNPNISMTFGDVSDGFEVITWKNSAEEIAKKCDGSVIEVFVSGGEELVNDEEQN